MIRSVVRALVAAFAVVAYALGLATFLYFVAFLAGIGVPKTVDSGPVEPVGRALAVDTLLVALFGVQHSVMARASFKRLWERVAPAPLARSGYVLATAVVLAVLVREWRPVPAVVWSAAHPAVHATLSVAYWL